MPLSSFTLHDLSALHIPPTFAIPSVEQPEFEQIFCLVTRMATSWCCGSSSFFGFNARCHLSFRKKVERFQCCIKTRTLVVYFLPAETFQRRRCDLGHVQVLVRVFLLEQDDLHDNDVNGIADCRVFVERRHHVHDRQKIRLDIAAFMKLHHRRISDNERFNMSRSDYRPCDATLVRRFLLAISFPVIPYFTATLNDNL